VNVNTTSAYLSKDVLMSVTSRYWLAVIVYWRPRWLSGLWNCTYVFCVFFRNPKTWLFTFFELLHTFSRTQSTSVHNNIAMRAHDHVIAAAVAFFASQLKRCSQLWLRCDCNKTCQSPCDVIILSYFNLLTSISYVIQVPPWRMKSS